MLGIQFGDGVFTMKLTKDEKRQLSNLLRNLKNDDKVLEMKQYRQHGKISTYDHVTDVTRLSFLLNKRLGLGADEKTLTMGAFLHDFYLYDWHIPGMVPTKRLHGFSHAETARKNAVKHFNINKNVQNVIEGHMWPLNITMIPKSKEAWIVCLADKWISAKETLLCR